MKIDIITLFPEMFTGPFDTSMLKKAKDRKLVDIAIHDLREYTFDAHRTVDDRPYGGGSGMVIRVDVLHRAIMSLRKEDSVVILLTPQGETYNQKIARKLAREKHLLLIAGHYEGFDERIQKYVDIEISVGNFILTGGEIPAMAVTDSIVRLIPGVLEEEAVNNESFSDGDNFDYPTYTRPPEYDGQKVPDILLTGHHGKIRKWRTEKAIEKQSKLKKQ